MAQDTLIIPIHIGVNWGGSERGQLLPLDILQNIFIGFI